MLHAPPLEDAGMSLEQRLSELGLLLPETAAPGARYAAVVVHDGLAWVSGQLPREGDCVVAQGKLGRDIAIAAAQAGARIALLRGLAGLRDELGGLRRVRQILKLTVYVNSTGEFTDHSAVADGASTLIYELLGGDLGRHARTSVGVAQLPRDGCVELDFVAALRE
jgi:enamine deaminase RidA (YjgF/YER057c/UK114 family)